MRLLLDTHALIWWLAGSTLLSRPARRAIDGSANDVFVSAASAWEISIKHAAGRLPLPKRPDIFVPMMREASGIERLDMDEESALHAGRLPGLHSDPFDRMLVAQAVVHGMAILTPDQEIEQYAVRVLW